MLPMQRDVEPLAGHQLDKPPGCEMRCDEHERIQSPTQPRQRTIQEPLGGRHPVDWGVEEGGTERIARPARLHAVASVEPQHRCSGKRRSIHSRRSMPTQIARACDGGVAHRAEGTVRQP